MGPIRRCVKALSCLLVVAILATVIPDGPAQAELMGTEKAVHAARHETN